MNRILAAIFILQFNIGVVLADELTLVGVMEETGTKLMFAKEKNWDSKGLIWRVLGSDLPSSYWKVEKENWTIAFDGKNIGSFTLDEPDITFKKDWLYKRDKKQ